MRFHILTLFPDMVMDGLHTSILGRAMESGSISAEAINIRDYSEDKHNHVDDTPYGGGAGMVMQAGPVYRAFEDLCAKLGKRPRVIYTTPQGRVFSQSIAEELAKEEDLVFLCGHYEGIDERALELVATDYLSIGDYVLTGGELPAMVMIDSISRLVPGVLNNETSAEFESFHDNLLEYPQYTRPETFMGKRVPEVLLTGHHKNIDAWRRKKSVERTLERRPELLKDAVLSAKEKEYLRELLEKQNAERKERAAGVCPESAGSVSLALRGAWEVIDLTQEIREDMPMFPGDEPPVLEHVASCGRDGYRETKLTFYSHTGTHADAPSHIADGRTRLEQFSLSHFIGQAFTIDASGLAEGESITMELIEPVRELADQADYLLFYTGRDRRMKSAGTDAAVSAFDGPRIDAKVANYLLKSGKLGMGTDAMSVDPADDENLTIHKKLMKYKDFVIVENLANLEIIAGTMCLFLAFPLKYAGADGAPVRAAAVREAAAHEAGRKRL